MKEQAQREREGGEPGDLNNKTLMTFPWAELDDDTITIIFVFDVGVNDLLPSVRTLRQNAAGGEGTQLAMHFLSALPQLLLTFNNRCEHRF